MWTTILISILTSLIIWLITNLLEACIRRWRCLKFIVKNKYIFYNEIDLLLVIYNPSKMNKGYIDLKLRLDFINKEYHITSLESCYGNRNSNNELQREYVRSECIEPEHSKELNVSCDYISTSPIQKLTIIYKTLNGKERKKVILKDKKGIKLTDKKIR